METTPIEDWAFALIPISGASKRVVALLGDVNGKFVSGTSRITMFNRLTNVATANDGQRYYLGTVDPDFAEMYAGGHIDALDKAVIDNR